MAWITEIPREEATGLLKQELDAAVRRAGRVWNIVQVMSLNAPVLKSATAPCSTSRQNCPSRHPPCPPRIADALGVEPEEFIDEWGQVDK